jgi:hypothetical protein
MFNQGKMSTAEYYKQFISLVNILDTIKASFGHNPGIEAMVAANCEKDMKDLTNEDRQEANGIYLATAFLLGCDCGQYGKLMENMENNSLQGCGTYPKTMAAAFNLVNWKQDPRDLMCIVGVTSNGISFATIEGSKEHEDAKDGVTMTTSRSSTKKSTKRKHGKERDMLKYKCGCCR